MAKSKYRAAANIDRWKAMKEISRSSAATPHRNRKRDAKRGRLRGGRRDSVRQAAREDMN